MRARQGFTLIEVIVVAAIGAALVGLLLPAAQKVREAANRAQCQNNLKQLGLALQQYHDAQGAFPAAYETKVSSTSAQMPSYSFRWSAHARLLPYLEQAEIYNSLDIMGPLFLPTWEARYAVAPGNVSGVSQTVSAFLCPSDNGKPFLTLAPPYADRQFGPTNYAACVGSGDRGGPRENGDGIIFVNSRVRVADIVDGTSNTAIMSENLLGPGGAPLTAPPSRHELARVYAWIPERTAMDSATCQAAGVWNTDGGSKWADGEVYCTLYDHGRPPNAHEWDCISLDHNWRAARSRHPGGVNVVLADGSVRSVATRVSLTTWRALGSRAGNEQVGEY